MRRMCSRTMRLGVSVAALGLLGALLPVLSVAGASPRASAASATVVGQVTTYHMGLGNPVGIAAGPDGALWFTNLYGNSIGRITTSGTVTNYTGTGVITPVGIAAGPDGALWFTNLYGNSIGRITTSGTVTNYTGVGIGNPVGIAAGPDGALWFTNQGNNSIGRITTSGTVTNYTGTGISYPEGIAAGPDGALWFTNGANNSIGRITTSGTVTNYTGTGISFPAGITAGPDGALWFTNEHNNSIGRIAATGAVTNYTGTGISQPDGIAAGPDGALWFTNDFQVNSIGRITTTGTVTSYTGYTGNDIDNPFGIAAGPDGAMWFTNTYGNSIGRITAVAATPVIVPGSATITEGNSGTRTLNVPVTLSFASPLPVTVHWATANSTATAPSDYATASGTVTFAPGETTKSVPITIKGDTAIEPNETLLVAFSAPTNATIGGFYGLGVGMITDDDVGAVTTRWTNAELSRLFQSAAYLNQTPEELQKLGVAVLSYLLAISQPRPAPAPIVPPPPSTGPVAYTTTWTASDVELLRDVEAQYSLTAEQAQKYSVQVLNFLLAIGGH